MLSEDGYLAEGTGENLFVIREGAIHTPPLSDGPLGGITRNSVMTIARDLGYEVHETSLVRTDLFLADEAFLTGTAAELTPIARSRAARSVRAGAARSPRRSRRRSWTPSRAR
jgi:branched-chain amino acid aminotransferase